MSRANKIKLLHKAKKYVTGGSWQGICLALDSARGCSNRSSLRNYWDTQDLKNYIEKQLGRHSFLGGWIAENRKKYTGGLKDARIAYIDWMIACYEEDIANGKT